MERYTGVNSTEISKLEMAKILNAIEGCLRVAARFYGRVFGGYVRDVIVPLSNNLPDPVIKFKDVDIWFPTQGCLDRFVAAMGNDLAMYKDLTCYPFPAGKYKLCKDNKFVTYVDLVIQDQIPVDDFHVNKLSYIYDLEVPTVSSNHMGYDDQELSVSGLIRAIRNKEAIMLAVYSQKLISLLKHNVWGVNKHIQRLYHSYIEKGWKIYCPKQLLQKSSRSSKRMICASSPNLIT